MEICNTIHDNTYLAIWDFAPCEITNMKDQISLELDIFITYILFFQIKRSLGISDFALRESNFQWLLPTFSDIRKAFSKINLKIIDE